MKLFGISGVLKSKEDEELIVLVSEGKREALEVLFERYKGAVMNYITQMTRNRAVAEELTQDIFIKLLSKAHMYQPGKKFSSWFWTIAKNTTLDYLRKKKEYHLEDQKKDDDQRDAVGMIESEEVHTEALLLKKATKSAIEKCMDTLPETQKAALLLKVYSELSYKEISDQISKTEKSVKSLLNRARNGLAECLKSCSEEWQYE